MTGHDSGAPRGEKVWLRPIVAEDVDRIVAWRADQEVLQFLSARTPTSREGVAAEVADAIARRGMDQYRFMICRAPDGVVVGTAGLQGIDRVNRAAGLDIAIGERAEWGKGLGSDAVRLILRFGFEDLDLWRIWLLVYSFNTRAIRSYKRVGFVLEGRFREAIYRGGKFHDVLEMGILAREWRALTTGES